MSSNLNISPDAKFRQRDLNMLQKPKKKKRSLLYGKG